MVVKSEIKHIKSLQQKKYRIQNGLFVVEGIKTVSELLQSSFSPYKIYSTDDFLLAGIPGEKVIVSPFELKRMSNLQTPNKVLGVFHIPPTVPLVFKDWILVLDAVKDPGNLGTIIRLCDWFGIRHLVCSPDTVDCYNPKVLQATMGSIARVNVVYEALDNLLERPEVPVYGAFMDGRPVYGQSLPAAGMLVMGNEAHGISAAVSEKITHRIGIPQHGDQHAESLNVAMATAILLNEIRRPTQR
jgi:TrmH family RNA methyltransferase